MAYSLRGALFDLDGVLVDTARFHYLAWRELAQELGFDFTEADNERLKGVSRMRSLDILLEIGGVTLGEAERLAVAERKNTRYVDFIREIDETELLPGSRELLLHLRERGVKIALGSASKNAELILHNTGIAELFDAVIDGNKVASAKPDPEVFVKGCEELGLLPEECVVFEDAASGIEAARRAGIRTVGIGDAARLPQADTVVRDLGEWLAQQIEAEGKEDAAC